MVAVSFRFYAQLTRCLCCKGLLQSVSTEAVAAGLPPRTRAVFEECHRCCGCYRIYWRGSHYQRLSDLLQRLLGTVDSLHETGL